jgi:hypothetical protein
MLDVCTRWVDIPQGNVAGPPKRPSVTKLWERYGIVRNLRNAAVAAEGISLSMHWTVQKAKLLRIVIINDND